jgi:hypothetical protein
MSGITFLFLVFLAGAAVIAAAMATGLRGEA